MALGEYLVDIQEYVVELQRLQASGQTTEHSFRPALSSLFGSIDPELTVLNEPRRLTDVGAPDFVFNRGQVAIGWCEAKDIGKDIRKFGKTDYSKDQKLRYVKGLPNLIYTNGLDFEFIRDGEPTGFVSIGELAIGITPIPENYSALEAYLRDFASATPLTITSSKRLASLMAGKAAIIKEIMRRTLEADLEAAKGGAEATDLIGQYQAFSTNLIHDITPEDFADIYAETIAYGLFAARLHDTTPETYSRTEALELLPRSNPFLRELFIYIAGPNLDDRLRGVIDQLCEVFRAADLKKILADFGKLTARQDPFLHFYEDFLAQYNPAKRKARGVWYTPEPVVNFIVRAVADVLKSEFELPDGLADTSRITINWDTGQNDKKGKPATIRKDVHRVQILDPACGTGTFLADVIKQIAQVIKSDAPGQWSSYVERDLIPRVHGFELLMASYAMCHMKLDMILTELGYQPSVNPPRLHVYLTNSLEAGERVEQTLFGLSRAIAEEAKAANNIKRQTPIMCVVGNPPYSGISQNNDPWITNLIEDYKYVDGVHFGERKHWLQDDYVKFIRLASKMVEKNGTGVVGFITNHGYLSNPTFRGMRNHLLRTFDKIYVIDLHGNANKQERSPDGLPDKNVFDIRQGVAILIGVKTNRKRSEFGAIYRSDLWGERQAKYDALWSRKIAEVDDTVDSFAPYYMFYNISREKLERYDKGISLDDLFDQKSVGAVTGRDAINVSFTKEEAELKVRKLIELSDEEARSYFHLGEEDARDWTLKTAKEDARRADDGCYGRIQYRPFDSRWTCYTGNSRGLYASPQSAILSNLRAGSNLALVFNKTLEGERPFADALLFQQMVQHHSLSLKEVNYVAPLYLIPKKGDLHQTIRLNFKNEAYSKFLAAGGLLPDDAEIDNLERRLDARGAERPSELKVLDYVYAILHWPSYRKDYAEFLSIDFPRIPLPTSRGMFEQFSAKGEQLRRLHCFKNEVVSESSHRFEGEGHSQVEWVRYRDGKISINRSQCFADVPSDVWEMQIGSYHPAERWLKDRVGRTLDWSEVRHFQKVLKVLSETGRIMNEIEELAQAYPAEGSADY